MTHFPADLRTEAIDPIAHAWARCHPRWPLPIELGGPGGDSLPMELPDPPHWKVALEDLVQTPAPKMGRPEAPVAADGDAELGPGKFLGKPCPQGHRVRYDSTKQCVICLRAAVKISREKRRAA